MMNDHQIVFHAMMATYLPLILRPREIQQNDYVFWRAEVLCVGSIGFIMALDIAARWLTGGAVWITLLVAILAGVVGAVLAILLNCMAIGIAGFLAAEQGTLLAMANPVGSQSSHAATVIYRCVS